MPQWWHNLFASSAQFMPHGHCYLWIPSLLWLHVVSDLLIGVAYIGIAALLWLLVRKIRLPFSPVFIAFGLFIALCGGTHFMQIWTTWHPDYWMDGLLKAATAAASVATAVGLFFVRPQVIEVVNAARLSEERRIKLESTNAELQALYAKVKEADELKSQFFANVSHELRTPLALIVGPAERMLKDANLTAEQHRQLQTVKDNGQALLKQVNDLLDLSRLEAGKMQMHYSEFDAALWFRRVVSNFEVAANQRDIVLNVEAPQHLFAQGDMEKLDRVLINLLSNALKFTPDGGAIEARLRAEDDSELAIDVADTGPGVRVDQRELIFERFRQAEGGSTRRYGGTGLGLAIVKDFVALHGGRVAVSEAEGGGALFSVRLPLRAAEEIAVGPQQGAFAASDAALQGALVELDREQKPEPAYAVAAGRPHLLIVEDNAEMRQFVADVLSDDYNILIAADGEEGLMQAKALRPDLILSDLMMPRMSGDQLVRALRDLAEFEDVPILLLTARTEEALRTRLLQEGAQDYLTKPFSPDELRARVNNLVTRKLAIDALRAEAGALSKDLLELAKDVAAKNRALQNALDAAEVARTQAEHASQVKTAFLGMISHEMRTPLSTVLMNLQLMERGVHALPPDFKPRLERLTNAAEQLTELLEGLLDYTSLESGRVEVQSEPVDLAELAAEAVAQHARNAPAEVRVVFEASRTRLPPLQSDGRLLRVILNNLLSNALKFTTQGAIIVGAYQSAGSHLVEVRDTGIGIAAEDLGRIFEPFEQLEPLRRKSIPGVGLGLALVKELVERLGGRIDVSSALGEGTSFYLILPSRPTVSAQE